MISVGQSSSFALRKAAKAWLNMRYHEHFLREILPTYATIAKNALESWDNAQNLTKNVG